MPNLHRVIIDDAELYFQYDEQLINRPNTIKNYLETLKKLSEEFLLEAEAGFEPANIGFANRRLRPLGHSASYDSIIPTEQLTSVVILAHLNTVNLSVCLYLKMSLRI